MRFDRRLLLIGFSLLFMFGCQPDNPTPDDEESAPPPGDRIPQTVRVRQTAPSPARDRSPQAVANRLVRIALQFPQVKGASAISLGRYTVVGIEVDPKLDRGQVGTLKSSVAEALQEDPQGSNALVTADPDLTQRIRELSEDMANGRPGAGLAEEVAEIAARIAPHPSKEVKRRENNPSPNNQSQRTR